MWLQKGLATPGTWTPASPKTWSALGDRATGSEGIRGWAWMGPPVGMWWAGCGLLVRHRAAPEVSGGVLSQARLQWSRPNHEAVNLRHPASGPGQCVARAERDRIPLVVPGGLP